MRYKLDNMDYYHIIANGTRVECTPLIQVLFFDPIDSERLRVAIERALSVYTLLKTRILFDREFYLQENDETVLLHNCPIASRPRIFGEDENGYPWQFCYYENYFTFEWCHVVTDGRGALTFLAAVLAYYFDTPSSNDNSSTEMPFRRYYDRSIMAPTIPKQPLGYANKFVKTGQRGSSCLSHLYTIPSKELLSFAHSIRVTPIALIAPLFSRALHECLPKQLKKANIRLSINIDTRIPMGFSTIHNAALFEPFSYLSAYDDLEIDSLCNIYKRLLELYRQPEYIVSKCTNLIDGTDATYRMRTTKVSKTIMKIAAWWLKERDTNAQLSYLGVLPLHENLREKINDCWFYMWPDIGYCNLNMIDCNGKFNLNICENFDDEQLIGRVINRMSDYGLTFEKEKEVLFRQAHMKISNI